jgi:LPS sulfotransferase NodH
MEAAERFVILTTPRTGSNYLCSLLNSHPQVLCHHELYNASGIFTALDLRSRSAYYFGTLADRDRDPLGFLARMWGKSFGRPVVGFKLTRGQNRAVFEAVLADRAVRKVVMRRKNRVKTYVSEMIAQLTGEWESYPGIRLSASPPKIPVPPAGLFRFVEHNETYFDDIARRLAGSGQEALAVGYEELIAGDAGKGGDTVERRIFAYLGIDPGVDGVKPATRKQNPTDLKQLITNFDELREALAGTELESELLEADGE